MNLKSRFILLTLLPLAGILLSCDDADDQREFEQQAMNSPSGYTETDASGNVINEDPDDWQIGPMFSTTVDVQDPAFPNPTTGDDVTINLLVMSHDAVHGLYVYHRDDRGYFRNIYRDDTSPLPPTIHQIRFDPTDLSVDGTFDTARGLHRIFIYDYNDNLITYGDVKVGED